MKCSNMPREAKLLPRLIETKQRNFILYKVYFILYIIQQPQSDVRQHPTIKHIT